MPGERHRPRANGGPFRLIDSEEISMKAGLSMPLSVVTAALLAACGGGGDAGNSPDLGPQAARIGTRSLHAHPGAEQARDAVAEAADTGAADDAASDTAATEPDAAQPFAARRPFPQHVTYTAGVIKPTNVSQSTMDSKVTSYYSTWKSHYVRTTGGQGSWVDCGKSCGSQDNIAVSEGHGYGMVISAYMGDQALFDSLYQFYRAHPSDNGPNLMAWQQTLKNGKMVDTGGADSATDGDLDIAYGLLLADQQWGSSGSINYRAQALNVMHDILTWDVNQAQWNTNPGDWARGSQGDENHTRPSDWMTDHFIAFAKYDTANTTKWNNVYNEVSKTVNYQFTHGSQNTGIVPDFMVLSGSNFVPVSGEYLETRHDGDFDYNACRTPWRLAMSYIVDGRTDMLSAEKKTTSWIRSSTGGTTSKIRAGYYIKNGPNGTAYVNYDDLAFTGPMAVNAMLGGSAYQSWLNSLWTAITGGDFGTVNDYYGDTIRMQVLITLSGNWWTP
jgi:endo-1,4-beta-D-glucanase Y